ncbi:MAG: molybdopterin-dependent oxidoreductase, partial [Planctomycetes bacterium]|nr:molybdopterin-dependent oxidoreductase [Planctomycetota bacterium]
GRALGFSAIGPDSTTVEGLAGSPYDFPNYRVDHAVVETLVPVGFWRSVGHSATGFFMESFLDELAIGSGIDPFAYRFALLQHDPRSLAV